MSMRLLRMMCFTVAATTLAACGGGGGGSDSTPPPPPAAPVDTTAPTVSATSPANGAGGVAINMNATVTFSEPVNCATVTATTFSLTSGGSPVNGAVNCEGQTATLTADLTYETSYSATLSTGIKDLAGNPLSAEYSWSFSTTTAPDITAPTVTSTTPTDTDTEIASNSTVSLSFSEPMDCATINASTFLLNGGGGTVAGTISCSGTSATLNPTADLAAGTTYTATLTTGAKDTAGNALAANYTWGFTTGAAPDTTPPTVTSTGPGDAYVDVPMSTSVLLTFSEPMDCTTINASSFRVSGVTGAVSCAGNAASFVPSTELAANTLYTATVTTAAKDAAGNALAADYSWSFTTILPPPSVSTLQLSLGTKQLRFDWNAAQYVEHYQLFENRDGVSGFSQVGADIPAAGNAYNLDVAVHDYNWANARYLLKACNVTGCTDSNEITTIDGVLQAIGYVKASNTAAGDIFGTSIALSVDGQTLAVGAPYEDSAATGVNNTNPGEADNSSTNAGAVYIYTRVVGRGGVSGWGQQAYIKPAYTGTVGQHFGFSVALSDDGNTLAVGVPGDDNHLAGINVSPVDSCNTLACAEQSGAAYVFVRSGTTWTQEAYIKASNPGAGDNFGNTIDLAWDGNTLAVGAPLENGNGTSQADESATDAGAVYVFVRDNGAWSQQWYLKPSPVNAGDQFGAALSLNGGSLAVGAPYEDSGAVDVGGNKVNDCAATTPVNCAQNSGATYLYFPRVRTNPLTGVATITWVESAYLKASNTAANDLFGTAVALSGDGSTIAVGAPGEDSSATGIGGSQGSNAAPNSGAVYIFALNANWAPQAYLKASNTQAGDQFGSQVALNDTGNVLAASALLEGGAGDGVYADANDNSALESGAVYLFSRAAGNWSQGVGELSTTKGYIKAANSGAYDSFGRSLALSGDGSTLAVGADGEASAATGTGGNRSNDTAFAAGAVYLY